MTRRPVVVRVYGALVRLLLPAKVRERDAREIVTTFGELWSETRGRWARARCLVRSFGRLPLAAAAEWKDHLASTIAARRARRPRAGGVGAGAPRPPRRGGIGLGGATLRPAIGALRRSPAFACGATLLLGLGIGASVSAFTIVDHLFLRPLPYPHADRLLRVNGSQSHPAFEELRALGSVEAWAAAAVDHVHLTGSGDPLRLAEARVTDGFFALFGARPALGRLPSPNDFAGDGVVVLSHGAWERIWGGSDDVLGRTLVLNGDPVQVVGVLSPAFQPPEALLDGAVAELWRPVDPTDEEREDRFSRSLIVAGRLAPGAGLDDASREASALAERRARAHPDVYVRADGSVVGLPVVSLEEATVGEARQRLTIFGAAVVLLLLVSCVNVAHLFMARGLDRAREMAVRRALGAGRASVVAHLLLESLLVAGAGCAAGVALAAAGVRAFVALDPRGLPRASAVALDGRVLAFAVAASVSAALAFGLLPMLRAARSELADVLRSAGRAVTGDRAARRAREGLLVAEVGLSLVLVFCAGLLTRSFLRSASEPLGFRVADVRTIRIGLPDTAPDRGTEGAGTGDWRIRMERMAEALRATPGVRSVAYGLSAPLEHIGGTCCWTRFVSTLEGGEGPEALIHPFAGAYADVFEPSVLAGRTWTAADEAASPPPALLNERLARALFGSAEEAPGTRVRLGSAEHAVVGVVAEDRHYGLYRQHGAAAYVPMSSLTFVPDRLTMAVRVEPGLGDVARHLRESIWTVEPALPLPLVRSMDAWAEAATAGLRFDWWLFATFAAAALVLAAGGIFGTLQYTVGLQRRALGIRMALGAGRRSVAGGVVARALRLAGVGAGLGAAVAWVTGRLLEARLLGVDADDPLTLLAAAGVLLSVAAVASWLPARHAGRVDPVEALRDEG